MGKLLGTLEETLGSNDWTSEGDVVGMVVIRYDGTLVVGCSVTSSLGCVVGDCCGIGAFISGLEES